MSPTRSRVLCAVRSVAACACAVGVCFMPANASASAPPPLNNGIQAPSNDNFLFSDDLNTPGTRLNASTGLENITDTIGAGVQQNIFDPCGLGTCRSGPAEPSTCQGVNYGGTVWYDFYPDHDGQVEIRTAGIPNVIALYSYDPRTLVPHEIQCEPGSGYSSNELFASVSSGVSYTYQIGGRNGLSGPLQMLFNYAYRSDLTVAPFGTAAALANVVGQPGERRLVKLEFIGITRNEGISYAAARWRSGLFHRTLKGNVITLSASAPPIVDSRTRFLVAATSPAQIGRFKLYRVNLRNTTLSVVAQGCLAPGTSTVIAAAVGDLSLLHQMSCPTTLINPTGAEYAFWRGATGGLWETWYEGGKWSPPIQLRTHGLGSPPTVAVHADGEQDVFWRGAKGNLWEMWYRGSWNGPIDLGAGQLGSAPSAGADAAGNEYVFWRGTDGGLWERIYSEADRLWSQPVELNAGRLGSAPSVAVHADGEQDVFWEGTDEHLWAMSYRQSWSAPIDLGAGRLGSGPSAGVDAAGNDYVFWRGTDGGLWEQSNADGQWSQPVEVNPGQLGSAPAVAVQADGEQDVFWEGAKGHLQEAWYTGAWHGPVGLGVRGLGSSPGVGVAAVGKQTSP